MSAPSLVLWIYIALLLAGGLAGFIKVRSKASLIISSIFAALLALCQFELLGPIYIADILLVVLLIFFARRFAKVKKVMPAGMMALVTLTVLILRQAL